MIESSRPASSVAPHRAQFLAGTALLAAASVGAGEDHARLADLLRGKGGHAVEPAHRLATDIAARFRLHAARWRRDTMFLSSSHAIAMHPDYQAIIGMGAAALPLILSDLQLHGAQWFWALKAISGEDPVVPQDRGSIERMRLAWLAWGRAKSWIA
jgi:hypothetical protein